MAGTESRERLGSNRLNVDWRTHLTVGHYDILCADWEGFLREEVMITQMLRDEALVVWKKYQAKPDKIQY